MCQELRGIQDPEEFEARLKELCAKEEADRAALREAWDHLVITVLEALRIPGIVSWLAEKLNKIGSK